MIEHFGDRLCEAVKTKKSPLTVGLDPVFDRLPAEIRERVGKNGSKDLGQCLDGVFEFCLRTMKVVAEHVPAVKLNIAYFEKYLWDGIEAYYDLITEADHLGMEVIGDVKRGDIGHSSLAYAQGHIKDPQFKDTEHIVMPDAITVNGFAGLDGIVPFADTATDSGRGIFVWVRASNPSAARIQDFVSAAGKPMFAELAEVVGEIAGQVRRIGQSGYSNVGMVIGGTSPEMTTALRRQYPNMWILVPGYGSQGGSAADCVRFCKPDGTGALINASRSIIYAFENEKYTEQFGSDWEKCIEQAAIDANTELRQALGM